MEKGKICSLLQVGECFSSFGVPGSFSQMMANRIILGQISFKFLGFPLKENLLVVKEPFLKDLEAFFVYLLSL